MNQKSLPRLRVTRLNFISLFLITSFALSLSIVWQTGHAQQTQLSLADILIALRSKKVSLAERNRLLTEAVNERGISFALTPEIEQELTKTGADKGLIEAVRQKSPIIKVSATPAPKPTPAPTPAPPDFVFYQNRGNAHFAKGEYDLALVNYNKVVELKGADATTYNSRGMAYSNKKSFEPAITEFDKAIELSPKDSVFYANRAEAFEGMGNYDKAILDYQKAVELDAKNELAKSNLQRLKNMQAEATKQAAEAEKQTAETEKVPDTVNLGALNSLAVKLAMPVYPSFDRQRNVEGLVTVQVSLDEEGDVISAKATSGPASLRNSSEDAARRSKFKPARVADKPVKAIGYITYNFKAN
jgi:TonB family protein